MSDLKVSPVKISKKSAPLTCPPDKSVTHRSFLFALMSSEQSEVRQPLLGQDCLSSLAAVRSLGAQVEQKGDCVRIKGFGVKNFGNRGEKAHPLLIDCGNSGTTIRLLSGLLAGQGGYFHLFGDASLSQRPMARISQPLLKMGAAIVSKGTPPVDIQPAVSGLRGMPCELNVASAQVKSAVLLAGLWCAKSDTVAVTEPSLSRDHTERMLREMGVPVASRLLSDGRAMASLMGHAGAALAPLRLTVGGDPSSAAFWACASVIQNKPVEIRNVLLNPTRLGFAEVLKRMGAQVNLVKESVEGGEDVGTVSLAGATALRSTEVHPHEIPTMIDEVPMLAIASLWASGTTTFRGVQELRVKESDRLAAIISFIESIGGRAWAEKNDLFVEGLGHAPAGPKTKDWRYETLSDHRLAMAAVITCDALQREIVLDDAECIKVSYPDFFRHREVLAK